MNKPVSRTLLVFVPLLVSCIVIRYLQLVYAIDFTTGFYRRDYGFLSALLFIVFAAGFILLIAAALWEKKVGGELFAKKLGRIHEADVRLTGIMLLFGAGAAAFSLATGYFEKIGIIAAFVGILGYALNGGILFIKKRINTAAGFLMILPAVYFTIRMIMLFMSSLVLTRISDHLIKILTYIFSVVFYLAAGRVFARSENRFTRVRFIVSGFAALGLGLSETLAKFVYWLTIPDSVHQDLNLPGRVFLKPTVLDAAECIIIFAIIMIMLKSPVSAGRENES